MAIGYGVAAPKPEKGSSRKRRLTLRRKLGEDMRDAVWLRALDKGNGGITIGSRCHHIRNARWDGLTMTGDAVGVTDAEMEAMFPGCGWDSPSINA